MDQRSPGEVARCWSREIPGEAPGLTFEADAFIHELNVLLAALEASDSDGPGRDAVRNPREHGQRRTLRCISRA
jgi:hypothetical protein